MPLHLLAKASDQGYGKFRCERECRVAGPKCALVFKARVDSVDTVTPRRLPINKPSEPTHIG